MFILLFNTMVFDVLQLQGARTSVAKNGLDNGSDLVLPNYISFITSRVQYTTLNEHICPSEMWL